MALLSGLVARCCRQASYVWVNRLGYSTTTSSERTTAIPSEVLVDGLFTEQHLELKRSLNKLIDQEINPYVDEWEAKGQFPAHEVFRKLGKAGFLGVNKPTEYGGLGLDYSFSAAVSEELGNINCGGVPMAIGVQTDMATPALTRFGSDELKSEFLVPAIAGDVVVSIGVSEPTAGSDVANIKTKAEQRNGDYIINGSKMWITNAFQADWICLLANTGGDSKHFNKSLIIVPMKTPGVHLTRKIDKLGMRSSDTAEIFFDNVRVPIKNRIGEEGKGFLYQMLQFQEERMFSALTSLKPLDKIIDGTAEYARQRQIFGQPLLNNQVVHYRLAELATETEALRSMTYRAVQKYLQGEDITKLASMCKVKAGRLVREASDSCLQYFGGMGFTTEMFISRAYRDMRLLSIGAGADEVMLAIICKCMNILPKPAKK